MRRIHSWAVALTTALLVTGVCAADEIRYSLLPDRSDAMSLDGAVVAGEIYVVFDATTPAAIDNVEFFIDGNSEKKDKTAPFDLAGSDAGGAKAFDTDKKLADGTYELEVQSTLATGVTETYTASFTVVNATAMLDPGGKINLTFEDAMNWEELHVDKLAYGPNSLWSTASPGEL